ncbi:MAG: lactate racemase domain-containing protein [Desulfocapsaceae bacterium]
MSLTFSRIDPTLPGSKTLHLPKMVPVRQSFPRAAKVDTAAVVQSGFSRLDSNNLEGKSIAITAGSRGIKGLTDILRAVVMELRARKARPFIVPAMGSHGGATAEGQVKVLESLGINEAQVGAPIRSSMEVVQLGTTGNGLKVFCDKLACQADNIVVCNRIKAHTTFKGDYESGIVKMLVIGLGKHLGAIEAHSLGFDRFHEILPAAAELALSKTSVLCGIGLIENAYSELAMVEVIPADQIMRREIELLNEAKRVMGRLLLDKIDILIVDEMGKDISGTGLDSNVTGRSSWGLPGFVAPPIQRIIVRDLTPATKGNATGIGLADFTTRICAEKIDPTITYTNAITAQVMQSAKIPIVAENDHQALRAALVTLRHGIPKAPLIVRIKNTKELETLWLSETYQEFIKRSSNLEIIGDSKMVGFSPDGSLQFN